MEGRIGKGIRGFVLGVGLWWIRLGVRTGFGGLWGLC
jgi:hypothetical protein